MYNGTVIIITTGEGIQIFERLLLLKGHKLRPFYDYSTYAPRSYSAAAAFMSLQVSIHVGISISSLLHLKFISKFAYKSHPAFQFQCF